MQPSTQTFQDTARDLVQSCTTRLRRAGFDLVRWFAGPARDETASIWNEPWGAQLLPAWFHEGTDRTGITGLLIGNTRALWSPFVEAVRFSRDLSSHPHPLNEYTASTIESVMRETLFRAVPDARHWIGYAHTTQPRPLPMVRLAAWTGLAQTSPSGLAIHSLYGPWIALRAMVLIESAVPFAHAPLSHHPCVGCPAPCMVQLRRAQRGEEHGGSAPQSQGLVLPQLSHRARSWLAVREACPIGSELRYSAEQISYHYDLDRRALEASCLQP